MGLVYRLIVSYIVIKRPENDPNPNPDAENGKDVLQGCSSGLNPIDTGVPNKLVTQCRLLK